MLELILILAILVTLLGYVLWPLLGELETAAPAAGFQSQRAGDVCREELEEELADLEYDRGAGKISLEDYERFREELQGRLHALPTGR
jgi:cytochrome c-type biogenesis protein CcmI